MGRAIYAGDLRPGTFYQIRRPLPVTNEIMALIWFPCPGVNKLAIIILNDDP